MIDVDQFKDFNDSYGHAAGDKCLGSLGELFTKFTQNFWMYFFRYGGEEFVAIAYGYGEKELLSIAESLRIAVQTQICAGITLPSVLALLIAARNKSKIMNMLSKEPIRLFILLSVWDGTRYVMSQT